MKVKLPPVLGVFFCCSVSFFPLWGLCLWKCSCGESGILTSTPSSAPSLVWPQANHWISLNFQICETSIRQCTLLSCYENQNEWATRLLRKQQDAVEMEDISTGKWSSSKGGCENRSLSTVFRGIIFQRHCWEVAFGSVTMEAWPCQSTSWYSKTGDSTLFCVFAVSCSCLTLLSHHSGNAWHVVGTRKRETN